MQEQPKYPPTSNEHSFVYQKPKDDQPVRYEQLRSKARELCNTIESHCPPSRERALAITNLEQAVMWANKSIAVNEVMSANTGLGSVVTGPRGS